MGGIQWSVASQYDEGPVPAAAVIGLQDLTGCSQSEAAGPELKGSSAAIAVLRLSFDLCVGAKIAAQPKFIGPSGAPALQSVGDCGVSRLGVCQAALVLR